MNKRRLAKAILFLLLFATLFGALLPYQQFFHIEITHASIPQTGNITITIPFSYNFYLKQWNGSQFVVLGYSGTVNVEANASVSAIMYQGSFVTQGQFYYNNTLYVVNKGQYLYQATAVSTVSSGTTTTSTTTSSSGTTTTSTTSSTATTTSSTSTTTSSTTTTTSSTTTTSTSTVTTSSSAPSINVTCAIPVELYTNYLYVFQWGNLTFGIYRLDLDPYGAVPYTIYLPANATLINPLNVITQNTNLTMVLSGGVDLEYGYAGRTVTVYGVADGNVAFTAPLSAIIIGESVVSEPAAANTVFFDMKPFNITQYIGKTFYQMITEEGIPLSLPLSYYGLSANISPGETIYQALKSKGYTVECEEATISLANFTIFVNVSNGITTTTVTVQNTVITIINATTLVHSSVNGTLTLVAPTVNISGPSLNISSCPSITIPNPPGAWYNIPGWISWLASIISSTFSFIFCILIHLAQYAFSILQIVFAFLTKTAFLLTIAITFVIVIALIYDPLSFPNTMLAIAMWLSDIIRKIYNILMAIVRTIAMLIQAIKPF